MLTEADAERKGFEERERRRRHVRDDARIKARHDPKAQDRIPWRGRAGTI